MGIRGRIRINEHIHIREVHLIAEDGTQIGIVPTEEALRMAREAGLDLVEVAPTSRPPVCKILDFNKLQYQKRLKAKESKKKSRQVHLKEVKFRPAIDSHDFATKVRKVRQFLQRGDKVKLSLMFRGRQIVHSDLGEKILKNVIEEVADIAESEGGIQRQGRFMGVFLVPRPQAPQPVKPAQPPSAPSEKKDTEQTTSVQTAPAKK